MQDMDGQDGAELMLFDTDDMLDVYTSFKEAAESLESSHVWDGEYVGFLTDGRVVAVSTASEAADPIILALTGERDEAALDRRLAAYWARYRQGQESLGPAETYRLIIEEDAAYQPLSLKKVLHRLRRGKEGE